MFQYWQPSGTLYPFVYGFPHKITNPKKGALIIIWLLGYHAAQLQVRSTLALYWSGDPTSLGV